MKSQYILQSLSVLAVVVLLGACSTSQAAKPAAPPMVPAKPIAIPLGKNWQVIEEAPQLTNEKRGNQPAFQTEQSVQPPGAPPTTPSDVRKLETPNSGR
ncbi:hypothetical protein GMLC_34280 [Geomonas limicola]|uniref:Lipoprotein n=1 Tax=Geomonas limicola TaxID=2740186 RepID=A0A6V8NFN1_9BACT|nr:hypothetical protein [Geomonas limicola]GFO69849.1 hypothetical protein GMLC_34280 [Geomonas limicola]